jgi:hypothetical protein
METKVCSKCKEEKNVCEFGKAKKSKDGLLHCCKKCNNERSKKYVKENYEKTLESQRNWRKKNPEWVKNINAKNYTNNKEYNNFRVKKWYESNPEKRKEYREKHKPRKLERRKERRSDDPIFNIINRVRGRLYKYLKSNNIVKTNKTFEIVGCTPEFLKEHLEKQFVGGMNWENRDEWHIDHIIPLSSAKTEEDIYKLCHYTNLQPLWAEENMKKSNKIID